MRKALLIMAIAWANVSACGPRAGGDSKSTAQSLIERAGPGSQFVDASAPSGSAIAHLPSGMTCPLPEKGAFDFGTFPPGSANEGAYCSVAVEGIVVTFMAIRHARPVSLDHVFSDAMSSMAARATLQPWRGSGGPPGASAGPVRIARLEGTINGARSFLRISMTERGGWILQQFATAPLDRAGAAEARAQQQWTLALAGLARQDVIQTNRE